VREACEPAQRVLDDLVQGHPYYFCSEECQLKFDYKPEHYRVLALERRQNQAVS